MPSSPKKMPDSKLVNDDQPSTLENAISVVLGLAVVLVIGAMIINTIRNRNKTGETTKTAEELKQEQKGASGTSGSYTVQAGDTLWSIAVNKYNDGYKWTEIKKANNLASDTLEKGQQLVIPDIAKTAEIGSTGPSGGQQDAAAEGTAEKSKGSQTLSTSTDKSYTVIAGDNLWNIAVAKYGNGYRWVDIAKANNLQNPNIIHSGNVLTLP